MSKMARAAAGALTRMAPTMRGRIPAKDPRRSIQPVVPPDDLGETGARLSGLVGRLAGSPRTQAVKKRGGTVRKAEGGKVASGMAALKALAKKWQEALDAGDEALAKRIKRQMEGIKAGSSREVAPRDTATERGNRTVEATFSKGGKVKKKDDDDDEDEEDDE